MAFEVKVSQTHYTRLAKIKAELGYVSSDAFFRTLNLKEFSNEVLGKAKEVSPKGTESPYGAYLEYIGARTEKSRDQFMKFADSWRISRHYEGTRIVFELSNLLDTAQNPKANAKFMAVEHGSRASTWIASKTFSFLGSRGWTTIFEGQSVRHAATPAADVAGKVRAFVEDTIFPQMNDYINSVVERRLNAL